MSPKTQKIIFLAAEKYFCKIHSTNMRVLWKWAKKVQNTKTKTIGIIVFDRKIIEVWLSLFCNCSFALVLTQTDKQMTWISSYSAAFSPSSTLLGDGEDVWVHFTSDPLSKQQRLMVKVLPVGINEQCKSSVAFKLKSSTKW